MKVWLAFLLCLLAGALGGVAIAQSIPPGCTTTTCTGQKLPAGYLTVSGNQITDGQGNDVRIACANFSGSDQGQTEFTAMANAGFNCVRIPWSDVALTAGNGRTGCDTLAHWDTCVANAGAVNLKVIPYHLNNESPGSSSPCYGFQQNGLWFDSGTGTDGTDGCGDTGTVTASTFQNNTVSLIGRYASNPTVVGYEFHHEPTASTISGTGSGNFSVSGGQLRGPNGSPVNILGIDLYTDNNFANGGSNFQLTTTISNTTTCQPLLSFYPNVAFFRFQAGTLTNGQLPSASLLQPYINCLTSRHIIVAPDYHIFGSVLSDTPDQSGSTLQSVAAWQNSLALANAGNPYFWQMTQNEPCGQVSNPVVTCLPGYQLMVRTLYSAIRNIWFPAARHYPGERRNNGANSYQQTNAACNSASSGSGPTGTGSGIGDGGCSWNFVGAAVAGGVSPILITGVGGQLTTTGGAWVSQTDLSQMTNVVFDYHFYPFNCNMTPPDVFNSTGNGCSSDPGTAYTDLEAQDIFVNQTASLTSKDGAMPMFFGENGVLNTCLGIDPSWPSVFNTIANGHNRVSNRIAGGSYFYHNWSSNACGFTQGNFDADNPVSLTGPGQNVAALISAGNGPVPPGGTSSSVTWGDGSAVDIRLACSNVGFAVNAVNPGVIEFCPGPVNKTATMMNGTALITGSGTMDLSAAQTNPVGGFPIGKIAYSVHEYPTNVRPLLTPDSGPTAISRWNTFWGYLESNGIAPVAVLEMGCSCDNTNGNLTDDTNWATSFVSYLQGTASGGPTFTGSQQGISTNWFDWSTPSGNPDGLLNADGVTLNVGQQQYWYQFLYNPVSHPPQVTVWNPSDLVAVTLSNSNLTATTSGANPAGVRSTLSKSSGKYCWQVTASTIASSWGMGIASASWGLGSPGSAQQIGIYPAFLTGQYVYTNNVAQSTGSVDSVNGEVINACADFTNKLVWFTDAGMVSGSGAGSWNNSNTCNPTVAACGISFSGVTCPCFISFDDSGQASVAVLSTTSMSVALPSGFSFWDSTTRTASFPVTTILGN